MKIYNEVTIDMNPESSAYGKHLSEDSHEYNGDVALCCRGGGDSGDKTPEVFGIKEDKGHPVHFWKQAGKLPTGLSSTVGLPTWLSGKQIEGISPFYQQPFKDLEKKLTPELAESMKEYYTTGAGQGDIPEGAQWGEPTGDYPWDYSATDPETIGNEPVEIEVTSGDDWDIADVIEEGRSWEYHDKDEMDINIPGIKSFGEGWYEPYYKAAVKEPLEQMRKGAPATQGAQFEKFGDVMADAGLPEEIVQGITEASGGFTGWQHRPDWAQGGAVLPKGLGSDLSTIAGNLELAQQAFTDEQKRIEDFRVDAGETKEDEMLAHRVERAKALSGREKEYEQAEAAQSVSGLAYSAPAEQQMETLQEENVRELLKIKRGEAETMKDYHTDIATAAQEETAAEDTLVGAKMRSVTDIKGLVPAIQEAGGDIMDVSTDILTGHQTFGENIAAGGPGGANIKGKRGWGWADAYFQEPDPKGLTELQKLVQSSQDFGTYLAETGVPGYIDELMAELSTAETDV